MTYLEGLEEYRSSQDLIMNRVMDLSPASSAFTGKVPDSNTKRGLNVVISDSGVYKFSRSDQDMIKISAANRYDFNPKDFIDARNKR